MTTLHKIITAVVCSLIVVSVSFIFSRTTPAYAGTTCEVNNYGQCASIAQVGSRTIDPNGNVTWAGISEDRYAVIPLTLPGTSGEMTELESFIYDISDMIANLFSH